MVNFSERLEFFKKRNILRLKTVRLKLAQWYLASFLSICQCSSDRIQILWKRLVEWLDPFLFGCIFWHDWFYCSNLTSSQAAICNRSTKTTELNSISKWCLYFKMMQYFNLSVISQWSIQDSKDAFHLMTQG